MNDPVISRYTAAQEALARLSAKPSLRAFFFSPQPVAFPADESGEFETNGLHIDVMAPLHAIVTRKGHYDIGIVCCHGSLDEANLFLLRNHGAASFYIAWFWDNHHHHTVNLRAAFLADLAFVSHWHDRHYLNIPAILPGPHLPAYSRQWSPASIDSQFPAGLPTQRSDALLGGFGRYDWAPDRNAFLEALMRAMPGHALRLGSVVEYFDADAQARLGEWANHKCHLIAPVSNDVSTRVFESLMTGQIPLIPSDMPDLDRVIAPEIQDTLPVVRYRSNSVEDTQRAWREALRRFDAEGAEGVNRRHAYARANHSLQARLSAVSAFIRAPWPFELATDGAKVSWKNWA